MADPKDRIPGLPQRNSNAAPERPQLAPMGNWPPPTEGAVERWDQYARRQMDRILRGRALSEWQDGEDRRRDIASAIGQSERSSESVSNPASETAHPMHPRDRRFFVGLGWLGIPAALVAAGGWGVFSGYPHAGSAVAFVGLAAAYFVSLYLTEAKPHKLPRPGPVVVGAAILSWAFIGWQTWMYFHTPTQGYTQQELEKKIAAAVETERAKRPPPTVVHDPPTPEQINKAAGDAIRQRDAQIAQLRSAQPSPSAPVLPPPLATRAPGDADREIPVLDDIYNVITTGAAPQPQEGTTLVGTWLVALQDGKGDDYLSRLTEFRSRVAKVDNDIVQAVLKKQQYCANDLCEILGARAGDGVGNAIDRFQKLFAGFYKIADANKTKEIRPSRFGGGAYNDVSALLEPHLKPVYDALNAYHNWVSSTTNKLIARRDELSKIANRQP